MEEQTVRRLEKRKWRLPGPLKIVLTVVLTLAVSTGVWCLLLGRSGLTMVQTYLLARFAFVDTTADLDGAVDAGLSAFVTGLGDRWSYYRTREQYEALTATRANNYVGIGITVNIRAREEGLLVESVTEGGPADKAGVLVGDVIIAADGVSLAGEIREKGSDYIKGESGTQVALTLLGEGGGMEAAGNQAKELGISDKVLFAGNKRNVYDYYQAMDYFVYPSRFEGLPGTVVEAQTSGLRCLMSDSICTEVMATELVQAMSIKESPEKWAEYIGNRRRERKKQKI